MYFGYELASLGQRLRGQLIDSVIGIVPLFIAAVVSIASENVSSMLMYIAIPYIFFYFLLADGFSGGQSYGKRLVGTAVVDKSTGQPCTYIRSFVRNFLLLFLGVIDWVFIFGKNRQRLGDLLARTIVIKKRV